LLGILPGENSPVLNFAIFVTIFQYCMWESKFKKKQRSFNTLKQEFLVLCTAAFGRSQSLQKLCAKYNFEICRLMNRQQAINQNWDGPGGAE
jgi:hypothetical protein